jgi:hypothetical protein
LWVERRLVVREWDCFCLGTAMGAEASRERRRHRSGIDYSSGDASSLSSDSLAHLESGGRS